MRHFKKLITSLTVALIAIPASAGSIAYIESESGAFGTLDLTTGAFQQIGPGLSDVGEGLVPQPTGSLLSLGFDGTLNAINPSTGVETSIGPTGLGDCSNPGASPCGPNSAGAFGSLNGVLYATDFAGNLYSVNPVTGQASKIGSTGLAPVNFVPGLPNANGTWTDVDESLFAAGGKLYANEDFVTINPNSPNPVVGVILPDSIYQINTTTGSATLVASTMTPLNAFVNISGIEYGFDGNLGEVLSVDLTNGNTGFVSYYDPAAGLISGAAAVPEPASVALAVCGLAIILIWRWRGCKSMRAPGQN